MHSPGKPQGLNRNYTVDKCGTVDRLRAVEFAVIFAVICQSQSCHSRATSGSQERYRADNHGQLHAVDDLAIHRSANLNAYREGA
jgi:hypothetical protein